MLSGRVLRLSRQIRYQCAIGLLVERIVVPKVEEAGRVTDEAGVASMAIADASSADRCVRRRYVQWGRHFVAILAQMVHVLISGSCVDAHRVFRHR